MYIDEKRGYLVIGIRGEHRNICGRRELCDVSCRIVISETEMGIKWTNALIDWDPSESIDDSLVRAIRKELKSICE